MAERMNPAQRGQRMLRDSGYAKGGAIHGDEAQDKKLIESELGKARIKVRSGGKIKGDAPKDNPARRARGGHVKGKPGIGKVNIVIAHGGPSEGAAPPPPMMPPPHPPMAGPPPGAAPMPPPGAMPPRPMMPPPGPGPGAPPPGMAPPGMMPHASGGMVRDRLGRFSGGGVR